MGIGGLKILGFILTGLGAAISIGSGIVSDKILDHTIDEKITTKLTSK